MKSIQSARAPAGLEGELRFRLTVCKNGSIALQQAPGSTMPPEDREVALRTLGMVKVPKLPADVAATMQEDCRLRIRYVFAWSPGRLR